MVLPLQTLCQGLVLKSNSALKEAVARPAPTLTSVNPIV